MQEDEPFVKQAFNPETDINLNSGTAQNAEKYGWKVIGYDVAKDKVGCWRLFYQDEKCTYLISDNLLKEENSTGFVLSNYYLDYRSGADVSTVGKRLNPKLIDKKNADGYDFFGTGNTYDNIRATAWLTDPDEWTEYTNGNEDAEFAIGSPTVELYAASFDAAADAAKEKEPSEERTKIGTGLDVGDYGYTEETLNQLRQSYNNGIYNKDNEDEFGYWWIASPYDKPGNQELAVSDYDRCFGNEQVNYASTYNKIRPVVCIQTTVFENSDKYDLIDDKVVEPE